MKFPSLPRHLTALVPAVAITACLLGSPSASAGHSDPVVRSAETYRHAVKDFERVVFRSDHMHRTERQIADALEDQTSRVLSRSRDWRRPERLISEFERSRVIERQVESIVFANPACPARALLGPAWQSVLIASDQLSAQIEALRYPVAAPPVTVPSCRIPSQLVPSSQFRSSQFPINPPYNSHRAPIGIQRFEPTVVPRQGTIRYSTPSFQAPSFRGTESGFYGAGSGIRGAELWGTPQRPLSYPTKAQRSVSRNDLAGYAIGALLSRMIRQ